MSKFLKRSLFAQKMHVAISVATLLMQLLGWTTSKQKIDLSPCAPEYSSVPKILAKKYEAEGNLCQRNHQICYMSSSVSAARTCS